MLERDKVPSYGWFSIMNICEDYNDPRLLFVRATDSSMFSKATEVLTQIDLAIKSNDIESEYFLCREDYDYLWYSLGSARVESRSFYYDCSAEAGSLEHYIAIDLENFLLLRMSVETIKSLYHEEAGVLDVLEDALEGDFNNFIDLCAEFGVVADYTWLDEYSY